MLLNDFIVRWNGKYIDTDNAYGAQCMDEMHQYCVEVLGLSDLSILAAPSAKAVWDTFSSVNGHELFDKIENTTTGVPQEGDIVFWNNAPYGHVAIFVEGDVNSFRSYDQNYPTGSPCHIQSHINYTNVGGWVRFKGTTTIQSELDKCRIDRDSHWNDRIAIAEKLKVENNMTVILADLDKLLTIEQAVLEKDRQIADIQKQAQDLQAQLLLKEQALTDIGTQVATLTVEVGKAQVTIDGLTKQNQDDQLELEALKKAAQISQGLTGFRKWLFNTFIRN